MRKSADILRASARKARQARLRKRRRASADERVAGAGRVRDGHGDRRGLRMAGRRIRRRAIRAACHDHHADAEGEQLFRCRQFVGAAGDEFDLVIAQLDQIRTGQESLELLRKMKQEKEELLEWLKNSI